MLRLSLVIALIIAVLAVVFALQNTVPIVVSFLPWEFQGSLALVLLLTLALGVLIGLLVSVPSVFSRSRRIARQQKVIAGLEQDLTAARSMPPEPPAKSPREIGGELESP